MFAIALYIKRQQDRLALVAVMPTVRCYLIRIACTWTYQNGVLLKPGTDYTATTGTTVVLVTGASLNDVVEMIIYDTFSVANSYTKAEADTRYPFKGNNSIIRLNGQTISADITIDSDENGVSAGPITQSATVTVNGYWSIV